MVWLQENWIIAVVGLVVAVVLLWWLFGRNKAEEIETPIAPSDEPKKPLEAVKPEIIAAEPARFKPKEPAPAPVAAPPPPPPPVPEPVAETPPAPEPTREPQPAPEPAPAPAAKADNLQLLKGVGPKMVALLNGLGVTRFQQIADWTDADVAAIDPQLGAFQGRIARDAIVDQAGYLARGDKAGFEAKYGALGGELQGS
ncbi:MULTISPECIES: hypothetical protein [unclassified Sphingopyxis]|jgi:predicted flap endonuclease-1-like 5' DNA nuclease|uniref:hypothetical protein n=1 Tax=unclassified Sphingopyxis TaxID=2614943 RepID=UPI00072FB494|nr:MULTISPECIES: hypothetical protein [unclassified Sphingopyxis]KTE24718.1 hypothetical protein ATE61_12450 [Sphingopyxis sp. H057]KTE50742.1 hypothetical protein ATE64_15520 [Sphingopyxis sp. H073]KTE51728.1 hypothetical protein ATE69_15460 [Sphingopyxis sp. H071]KTE56579.1 hypothetical protein ATE66_18790 [Sphingopyxis sp. H107]KTE64294.1 hypothetical protein ATE65_12215 [Sphingopyxis sp. H100]